MAARAVAGISDAAFTERVCVGWAQRMGIFIDLDLVRVQTITADGGFAGRGVFVNRDVKAGEFFAMIPQTATLRASDLGLSTRRYFADLATAPPPAIQVPDTVGVLRSLDRRGAAAPGGVTLRADAMEERDMAEAFGRGFQVIARGADSPFEDLPVVGLLDVTQPAVSAPELPEGTAAAESVPRFRRQALPPLSSEERDWWQLAMVLALERRRGAASPWHDYIRFALPQGCLMDVAKAFEHQLPLLMKGRLPSPETTMKPPSRNESPLIAPLSPADFAAVRKRVWELEMIRSGYAWRFAAMFNRNLDVVARSRGYQGLEPTALRPSDLRWAMDVVTSRANNFSFYQSTERPRPYGVSPDPIPGAESTLCPVFDLLNHSMAMNVLIADVRIGAPPPPSDAEGPTRPEGDDWTGAAQQSTAALTVGALRDLEADEELCYVYNAPVKRNEATGIREVDVAGAIARWGFLPPPPLT
mmetsp:Transcript_53683/g.165135  ORF Transcript_53683/g.165135 Transcript_53683/m.165135 type:complete len:472 (-) Transcript_53683:38-1453(-)|eukprot:CAMPEP_0174840398 /NCGR_PEP_ID=MMETSP1114-20130205/8652_1 /TAXON_ID=312471 /ORGANISM="Neobodo designis, Strain CCAP 1951/1" /LENGTH=471 /DNA_ID=CAMNT_0016074545 /DNA_START=31 /DNA_END=1446 /DNA_ORIENTATION=+